MAVADPTEPDELVRSRCTEPDRRHSGIPAASRNDAINGAMPMPPQVRQVLQYWYPPDLLNIMRWKIGLSRVGLSPLWRRGYLN
jgi:hypothetical protein